MGNWRGVLSAVLVGASVGIMLTAVKHAVDSSAAVGLALVVAVFCAAWMVRTP